MSLKSNLLDNFPFVASAPILAAIITQVDLTLDFEPRRFGGILLHSHSWVGAGLKAEVMLGSDSRDF